jgi:hypothetical protein
LKRRDVAAFLIEPIGINLGVLIPEKEPFGGLRCVPELRWMKYRTVAL